MARPPRALPPQLRPAAAAERLRRAARFVERALPLCRAHTVECYTRGLWERLVAPRPAAVLDALRAAGPLAPPRPLAEASGAAAAALWGELAARGRGEGGPRALRAPAAVGEPSERRYSGQCGGLSLSLGCLCHLPAAIRFQLPHAVWLTPASLRLQSSSLPSHIKTIQR